MNETMMCGDAERVPEEEVNKSPAWYIPHHGVYHPQKPSQWRYVPSEDNPADHASRGLKAKELIASNWFNGPDFLWCEELPSGDSKVGDIAVEDPEVRKVFVLQTLTTENSLLKRFLKFSNWTRLVKAIAKLKRCVKEFKGLTSRTNEASNLGCCYLT